MKSALTLVGSSLLLVAPVLAGNEDRSKIAPFPAPRHSGTNRVAFTSNNVQLLGWLPLSDLNAGSTSGNDCWGYTSPSGREYAIIGLDNGTAFVEVTDPGAPDLVSFKPSFAGAGLWRGVKVHGAFAYAGSEQGDGLQIFNMTNIDSGTVTATHITGGSCTTATHTLAVDNVSGFLYRAGGQGCGAGVQGLQIYSLATPATPTLVGQWNTGRYVHECQVETWTIPGPFNGKQIAFCFTEDTSGGTNPRLQILDVTNKAAISIISTTSYTGGSFSHQGWTSANKQHLYLNDELDDGSFGGARTRVFSINNLAAPSYLGFFTSGALSIDHNLYVLGNTIFESNYRSGLRVFDNTNPTAPTQIGFFDTYPEDDAQEFNSLWSNYPYFPSGTVIGGDIEKGLWVWRTGAAKLAFDFPSGVPEFIGPGGGSVQFNVTEDTPGDLQGGTVKFNYSTGGPFTSVTATSLGGDLYEAIMPAATCGASIDWYVSARSTDLVTWTDPPAGPTQVYEAIAAYDEIVDSVDTFETNTGWLVNQAADLTGFSTASTGTWARVNPLGTSAQPEDDHSNPGTICWVTQQGAPGGGVGDADVDGGATSLRSVVLDASGMIDPHVSYWRWYSNSAGSNPGTQTMTVDISNNGGSSWVNLETVGPTGLDVLGGWIKHDARIADFVAPTNNMRLRFRAADLVGAIVEAGVDDVTILDYDCTPPDPTITSISPATGPFNGGNLVTITGSNFQAGVTTVQFGQVFATAVSVIDANTMNVIVPRPIGGSGRSSFVPLKADVTVSNGAGIATLPKAYTYQLPSVIR